MPAFPLRPASRQARVVTGSISRACSTAVSRRPLESVSATINKSRENILPPLADSPPCGRRIAHHYHGCRARRAALAAIEGPGAGARRLADERKRGRGVGALQAERAALGAKGRQIETEAAPIRYVAASSVLPMGPKAKRRQSGG